MKRDPADQIARWTDVDHRPDDPTLAEIDVSEILCDATTITPMYCAIIFRDDDANYPSEHARNLKEYERCSKRKDFGKRLANEVDDLMALAWLHGFKTARTEYEVKEGCTCCPVHPQ